MFGILVAFAGMIYAAGVWAVLNRTCETITITTISGRVELVNDQCKCFSDIYETSGSYICKLSNDYGVFLVIARDKREWLIL